MGRYLKRARFHVVLAVAVAVLTACEQQGATDGATGAAATQPSGDAAATKPATLEEATEQTRAAVAGLIRQAREKYREDVKRELERFEGRMQELKESAQQTVRAARPEVERRLTELRQKAAAARETLDRLKDVSDDAWKEARRGLDRAVAELRAALDEASAETQPATQPALGG